MSPAVDIAPSRRAPRTDRFLKLHGSPFIDRTALRGFSAVAQLAEDMRLMAAVAGDAATESDMLTIGWSKAQLALHGQAARECAYARAAHR